MIGEIVLTIAGTPVGKGSLKCVGRGGRHQLVEDNPATAGWRGAIALSADVEVADETRRATRHEPLGVEITSTVPRPTVHYSVRGGVRTGDLKPSAPRYPATRGTGDVDKLARLVLDALQDSDLLVDDAQVVEVLSRKAYPDDGVTLDALTHPGVRIRIYPIGEP